MRPSRVLLLVVVAVAGGCTSQLLVGLPSNVEQTESVVGLGTQGKSDLLFMIDNSPSMDAMQAELRAHFGDLVKQLSGLNRATTLDLHIGVVTSDYGAGDMPGGGCGASPGGEQGRLQAKGVAADPDCLPPLGMPFIQYQLDSAGNVTSNLPPGQDLEKTFTCMASVGAAGCGFEHQLESVYAALRNNTENAGFVRDDAALAVLFLTNEDDGSAAPTAKFYESSADVSVYGAYDTFRQTRFAIECAGAPVPYGDDAAQPLSSCVPAPDGVGLAYDIGRYTDFFSNTRSGDGLKDDPSQIALLAIAAPATPVATALVQTGTGLGMAPNPQYIPCGPSLGASCVERLQHSCQNSVDPAFFGDPAIRIEAVLSRATVHQVWSICGDALDQTPSFGSAMQGVGSAMAVQAAGGCLPGPLVDPQAPSCTVTIGGAAGATPLPRCQSGVVVPCWDLKNDPVCPPRSDPQTGFDDTYRLVIENAGGQLPHATCLTYSQSGLT
jgi:hypothetical protein